jgi:hypothetical protein
VAIVFAETRKLAEQWTYRFLAAAATAAAEEDLGQRTLLSLVEAEPLPPTPPTAAEVRAWARREGYAVSDRGRIPREVVEAYRCAGGG